MIRYTITEAALVDAIEATRPGWSQRAANRTAGFVSAGAFSDTSPIWSEIKDVYRWLQHHKCAYCERPLPQQHGAVEHDIEHFRPKSRVKPWRKPRGPIARAQQKIGNGRPNGYHWLAYHPLNYATSCKVCNSALKADRFPIFGTALTTVAAPPPGPETLNESERPALLYPISEIDRDPEELLTFEGHVAVPRPGLDAIGTLRAQVNIAFFDLNGRSDLIRERARVVRDVFTAFDTLHNDLRENRRARATRDLDACCEDRYPFAACARAFRKLCEHDPERAWRFHVAASEVIRGAL